MKKPVFPDACRDAKKQQSLELFNHNMCGSSIETWSAVLCGMGDAGSPASRYNKIKFALEDIKQQTKEDLER